MPQVSDHAKRAHGFSNPHEARDIGTQNVIAGRTVFICGAVATVVDIDHDLRQALIGLGEGPAVGKRSLRITGFSA